MLKRIAILCLIAAVFSLLCSIVASAQEQPSPRPSMDHGFANLRNNAFPHFNYHYDDYLQYSPAALMLAMKTCGYKSQSDWGRMLTADALSAVLMAGTVNGLKYSTNRLRPDQSKKNSFPSGHTATAFMCAGLLNHEYSWRSPWIGFAGYTAASVTALSRIGNNKHWATDIFAGALIGIGSVELGYYLTSLIFKDKHLYEGYEPVELEYCSADNTYYSLQLGFKQRFIIGAGKENKANSIMPYRGGDLSLVAEIPILEGSGVCIEASAGSLEFKDLTSYNVYSGQVGLYWAREFNHWLEFQVQTLIGYAGHKNGGGIDFSAATSLNLITGNNYKIRGIAEWEIFPYASREDSIGKPYLNSMLLGFNAAFFW